MSLWSDDFLQAAIPPDHCADVLAGLYDIPSLSFNEPPVVLDLGANIGAFARWAREKWPSCTLHCFEPHPSNYALLFRTAAILGGNINLSPWAVLDSDTKMPLYPGEFNCGEHSLAHDPKCGRTPIMVEVIDAVRLPLAEVVKVDTEGAEWAILHRMATTGRLEKTQAIMLEWHRDEYAIAIPNLLGKFGFTLHERKDMCPTRGEMKFLRK